MVEQRWRMLLLCVGLAGCKLVDQTNFGAAPMPPAPDQLAIALRAGSGVPLVVIRNDGAEAVYADALQQAVQMAEARRPGGNYDVTTIVPARGPIDEQINAAARGQQDAADVMAKLSDLGVAPDRMHLSARTDPALTRPEIRIYVHGTQGP